MQKLIYLTLISNILIIQIYAKEVKTITWNILDKYGDVNGGKFQKAVNDAIKYRKLNPNTTIILSLPKGKYSLERQINFTNMNKNGDGWLIIKGEGIGTTELIDTEYETNRLFTFKAVKPHRLKFSDFSLSGSRVTSSQGTVKGIGFRHVDIMLDPGFPTPIELYETETTQANKLLLIDDTDPDNPHFVEGPNNDHYFYRILWFGPDRGNPPKKLSNDLWRFYTRKVPPYKEGDRIAISSKAIQSNWGMFRDGGSDIMFENIALLRLGRIKFTQKGTTEWKNIRFTNISILRHKVNNITAFYSTDAGPQFGQDGKGGTISNLIVENCDFRGVTDDGTAFQHVLSGVARNNRWEDGRVLVGSGSGQELLFENNIFYHSPLEDHRNKKGGYKGAYEFSAIKNTNSVSLMWKSGKNSQQHDVYFGTDNPPPFIQRQKESIFQIDKLKKGSKYYWRINEYHNEFGINIGDVQQFVY